MPVCLKCQAKFPNSAIINGKRRYLNNRKFCIECSPFGMHNTKNLIAFPRPKAHITPLPPSENLAYLIGIISGDGSISRLKRVFKLVIACDVRYPVLIQRYVRLIHELLNCKVFVRWRRDCNCADVYAHNANFPQLLGLPAGTKSSNGFEVPEWIFASLSFAKPFVRGLVETDGGVYRTFHKGGWFWYCEFTAKHEPIMLAFLRGTQMMGYSFVRKGIRARLSNTKQVKRLVGELDIDKIREYVYP